MDTNELYSHVPITKRLGEINHEEFLLTLRESKHPMLLTSMGASIARTAGAPGAAIALVDDPEPTEPANAIIQCAFLP
jgi:hypothetical protein